MKGQGSLNSLGHIESMEVTCSHCHSSPIPMLPFLSPYTCWYRSNLSKPHFTPVHTPSGIGSVESWSHVGYDAHLREGVNQCGPRCGNHSVGCSCIFSRPALITGSTPFSTPSRPTPRLGHTLMCAKCSSRASEPSSAVLVSGAPRPPTPPCCHYWRPCRPPS